MNRRAIFATLRGKKQSKAHASATTRATQLPTLSGLTPYTRPWTYEQAAHLLRRTTFGPSDEQIRNAVNNGMDATIAELLADRPLPDPPVNFLFDGRNVDNVPIGETWVRSPRVFTSDGLRVRFDSFEGWTVDLWLDDTISIREKMVLFWHNHFVISLLIVRDPRIMYDYITLLRENALGNFRELAKAITVNPGMLIYLNGNVNTKEAPNENYARELLELFTVGKGNLAGEGDYTTFTEQDVQAIARILTGWREQENTISDTEEIIESVFDAENHDTSTKQLSARFDNALIENAGENEYANLIDIIFQSPAAATHICRQLYQWFVYYKIDEQAEAEVIEPMAQILRDNDYNILPVVEALLKSEHFYNVLSIGPMIKHPIDFILSALKPFPTSIPVLREKRYMLAIRLFNMMRPLQMEMYNPPEVAGWKAWYQSPSYYRSWINAISLPVRQRLTNYLSDGGLSTGDINVEIDILAFVNNLDNAMDPNLLIESIARILFPRPLLPSQIEQLKEILIPGLPDFEWTVEYGQYRENPHDSELAMAIESKLRDLLKSMMRMAEFYLS